MVTFSKEEIKDLAIVIVVITLLFAYLFSRSSNSLILFLYLIPIAFVGVGLSFLLHELGHKIIAQKYGFFAEFKKNNRGLLIAIITGLFGFVFLAPGAVYIGSYTGRITEEENGKISLGGPVVNIALAILFAGILISIKPFIVYNQFLFYIGLLCNISFQINSYLALFNLLPIPPLDGSKVIKWNMPLWITTIITSGILTYVSYTIPLL
ncbi:MAG: site-2 protease family protein [Methanosphaera stadtmanae]|nr:site-2 protease family protein [Methanosphaera stadtmanae]